MASLTDPRRDLGLTLRPRIDVATSVVFNRCRDISVVSWPKILSTLNNSFSLNHTSFVATSFTCCFGNSGRKLNFKSRLRFSFATSFLLVG